MVPKVTMMKLTKVSYQLIVIAKGYKKILIINGLNTNLKNSKEFILQLKKNVH